MLAVCPSGYYGDQCQFTCPSNMLYGEQCINECACSVNGNCSPVDGSCDCNPGYTGSTCSSGLSELFLVGPHHLIYSFQEIHQFIVLEL